VRQSSAELIHTLKSLGILDHLSEAEFQEFAARSAAVPLPYYASQLDILRAARDTIWYFETLPYKPLPQPFTRLKAIARDHADIFDHLSDTDQPVTPRDAVNSANALLAGAGSDDRFYFLMYPDDGEGGPVRPWAAIYLTYEQRHHPEVVRRLPFAIDQPQTWMPRRIHDLFDHLRELGLLDRYADDEITARKNAILSWQPDRIDGYSILQHSFPDLCPSNDGEMIYNPAEDYRELIEQAAALTGGIFQPDNLQVSDANIYNPDIRVTFDWQGQPFEYTLRYTGDYVDMNYLRMLNELLATREAGSFELLHQYDQCFTILYLSPAQKERARQVRRLPLALFGEEFFGPYSIYARG
jgi:hypothetical protein